MEVRRAMFLRACNHNLEKMAYPLGFRAALGGFLVGCVELGMSGFSKWRALQVSISGSNSPKNRGETGIFAKSKTRDSRTDGKVIVLLSSRHISSLFA